MVTPDAKTFRHLQAENVRLKSENNSLRNYTQRLQAALTALVDLQQSIENISSETNIFHLIHNIVAYALEAVDSENGSLMLLDEETGELVFVEVIGDARDKLLNFRLEPGLGVAGWVVKNLCPRLVENVSTDPFFSSVVDRQTGMQTRTLVCVPLVDGERRLGAIEAVNTTTGRPFSQTDLEVLQLVGRLASLAIVQAEKETT